MSYNIDLSAISLNDYMLLLKNQNLLPGRRVLLDNIECNFEALKKLGISNAAQLKKRLSTREKLFSLADESGISEDYLAILKRELGSLEQKPVLLSEFPEIELNFIKDLEARGIKNSKDYFEIGKAEKNELYCLCDMVRVNGVGPAAAKTMYEAGYRSVSDIANAEASILLQKVSEVNSRRGFYKARLGTRDMQFCIDFAALILMHGE